MIGLAIVLVLLLVSIVIVAVLGALMRGRHSLLRTSLAVVRSAIVREIYMGVPANAAA